MFPIVIVIPKSQIATCHSKDGSPFSETEISTIGFELYIIIYFGCIPNGERVRQNKQI